MISVLIPMRNEKAYVRGCLDSIIGQIADRSDVEILAIDGASTDGTDEIVRAYAARDERIQLVENPRGIVPTGMNLALARARGRYVVRLDCHATYAPDYLDACAAVLERTGADNVGGYIETLPGSESAVGRAIAVATSHRFGVGGSAFRVGGREMEVDTVPFGAFRRSVFDTVGLYDERLARNQDIELNARIRAHGGRIVISPKIRLQYYNRGTFAGLRDQAFHNGLWNPYTVWLVGGGLSIRHFVPMLFVMSLFLCGAAAFACPLAAWAFMGIVSLYVVTAALMGISAALKRGCPRLAPLVFAAFVQLHFAYGIGSLCGVITAPIRFGRPGRRKPIGIPAKDGC